MTESAMSGRWLRDLSITTKLAAIVAVFVAIIVALLLLTLLCFNIASGVRAYVGGEGLWSKGQKDAVYHLTRYARSQDPRDYGKYAAAVRIPLGDRQARLELEQPGYDYAVIEQGFVQGGNAAEDVPDMVFLFRRFRDVAYMSRAIDIWARADTEIAALAGVAAELRAAIAAGSLTPAREDALIQQIEVINARVTPLEHEFSATLGQAARWTQRLLLMVMLGTAALLLCGGLLVAWWISRELRAGILDLREGALRVSGGDLEHPIGVRSRDELGELATVFNDMVGHRREAEVALRGANEFRERIMQSASNAIYALDLEGRFTLVNLRSCQITGYSAEQLVGANFRMLYSPERLIGVNQQFDFVRRGLGVVSNYETQLTRQDGRTIAISFSIAPLMKDGEITGVVGTAEDISERKQAEAQREAHASELARSNAELEQFAYVASHDLQAPLRGIVGFAQLLQRESRDKLDGDTRDYLDLIVHSAEHMQQLIEGLLAFSRVGRMNAEMGEVNAEEVLAQVENQLRGVILERGVQLTHDPLPVIQAAPREIYQLLQNLVSNAIKFQPGENPRVHLSARREGGGWRFTVRDQGIGIDPQHHRRIFQIFQRLHTEDQYEGTGIGLAICEKIVHQHGGRIWVESQPGQGTSFHFTIPDRRGA